MQPSGTLTLHGFWGEGGLGNLVLCPKNIQVRILKPELLSGDPSCKRIMTGLAGCLAGLNPTGSHLYMPTYGLCARALLITLSCWLLLCLISPDPINARKVWFPRFGKETGRTLTRNTCLDWASPWPYSIGTHSAQLSVLLSLGSSRCMESLGQETRNGDLVFSFVADCLEPCSLKFFVMS